MSENNWTPTPLGEILEIKYGKDHKHLADGEFPVFGSGGIMRYAEKPLYDKPSILIPRKGTLSNLFYVDKPFWSVDTMFYTKINEQNNSKYIYYFLKSIDLAALNVGSAVPSLTTEVLNNVEIKLPNRKTQDKIASILSSLDDKIELNNQMNQTLEQIAQAIFKEWFVEFNFPGFDGNLVDGLPKGWRKESIDKNINYLNGLALQKYPVEDGEDYLPVIKIRELRQGVTSATDKANFSVPENYIIKNGDILFSWSGSLDIAIWNYGTGALNQHLFKVSSNTYPKWFYYFWTKHFLPIYRNIAASKATTMGHIQRRHLTESLINVPDEKILKKADEVIKPLFDRLLNNAVQCSDLAEIRNNLLSKLLNGNIKPTL